jgi:MFS family permease
MFSLGTKTLGGLSLGSLFLAFAITAVSPDRIAVTLGFCAVGAFFLMTLGLRASTGHNDRYALMGAASSANSDPRGSFAPVLVALAGGLLVLGAALGAVAYLLGLVALMAGAMFWMIDTWREHPLSSPKISARVSDGFSLPFIMPLVVLGLIGFAAISFSRIFLSFAENESWIIASVIAVTLFVGSFIVALLPKKSNRVTFVIFLAVLFVAIGAVGLIGLVRGQVKEGEKEGAKVEKSAAALVVDSK